MDRLDATIVYRAQGGFEESGPVFWPGRQLVRMNQEPKHCTCAVDAILLQAAEQGNLSNYRIFHGVVVGSLLFWGGTQ